MAGNVRDAAPNSVMLYALRTALSESRVYLQLRAQYHGGTTERSQPAQTLRRTFKLAYLWIPSATNFPKISSHSSFRHHETEHLKSAVDLRCTMLHSHPPSSG